MRGPGWNRLAAATGIGFAALIAATGIIGEMKDIAFAGDVARASNEVYGTLVLLTGMAAVLLFWFTGTLAARLRQLEGGSGRLAAVVNGSGAILAGMLALGVGTLFAARNGDAGELATLATGILDGPMLFFPAAAYVAAAGVVGIRAEGLPGYSLLLARLSLPLAGAFLAMAGLQIFKYYAWINEVGYISFIVWVLLLSIIGVMRWGDMDEPEGRPVRAAPPPAPRTPLVVEETVDVAPVPRPRKPAARKSTARKATRKPPARKV